MDYHSGINGLGEWTANYGTGRVLKHGEQVTTRMVLRIVAREPTAEGDGR